jgi:membrane-bound metal-dependent hydrolase YbcI (DUF457 family)
MFINSHIASGYLAGIIAKQESKWAWLLIFSTILPDIDGIWSSTVAGHHSILHTPIFWIVICSISAIIGKIQKRNDIEKGSRIIFAGAMLHLITDWLTARTVGIQWLYPLSQKDFYLFQIQPEQGQVSIWEMIQNPYFSFYMENAVLFWAEIGVTFVALSFMLYNILYDEISN